MAAGPPNIGNMKARNTDFPHSYVVALGSNKPRRGVESPSNLIDAAIVAIATPNCRVSAQAKTIRSAPIGPSQRRYANSVILVHSSLAPPQMLRYLQDVETSFGRKRARRWGARTLDCDIILWSGGKWRERGLIIPHPAFSKRPFVLAPAATIAPQWRDPISGKTVQQLHYRMKNGKAP